MDNNYYIKNRSDWISKQTQLLELERDAEVEASVVKVEGASLKKLQDKGVALCNLVILEQCTGLFGHPCVTFTPKCAANVKPLLPSHSFSSGVLVGIWEKKRSDANSKVCSGVVSKVTQTSIQVIIEEEDTQLDVFSDDSQYLIHKLASDVTYRRIKQGLKDLEELTSGPSSHLIGVLFEENDLYSSIPNLPQQLLNAEGALKLFNNSLDKSQQEAIEFALKQKELAVIHGPPGTGKTTTLVEIILQHVKLGSKVLAVAPSNLAVDNLLERLVVGGIKVVRIGHPARATVTGQQRTLDAFIQSSDDYEILQDIHKDIKTNLNDLKKIKDKGRKRRIKEDLKSFRRELKDRELRLSQEILKNSNVILATLTSAGDSGPLKLVHEGFFDLVVIDECSQGLESSCYMSIMKTSKLLIAGDHQQLPPTVLSPEASSNGLLVSLMERIISVYGERVTKMLKVQYRMNKEIMNWASACLYNNQLEAHHSVSNHLLCHLEGVERNEDTENALVLIDTAGCGCEEMSGEDLSKGNEGEAAIVAAHVKNLLKSGVPEKDIAVITPYNLQVELIRHHLREKYPAVEIRSVDGFQGREKEAVVISLVRSNQKGEVGFLSEDRRLNVAVTRARRHMALICDTDTVSKHKFIQNLIEHIQKNGLIKSGYEFESVADFIPSHSNNASNTFSKKTENQKMEKQLMDEKKRQEETDKRKKEFEKKIKKFICSKEIKMEFSSELNSFDRLLIHEIAEKCNLIHESHGEGKERVLAVLKKTKVEQNENIEAETSEVVKSDSESKSKESINKSYVHKCLIKTEVNQDLTSIKSEDNKKFFESSVKAKKEKKKAVNKPIVNEEPVIDEDIRCDICKKTIFKRNFDLHYVQCERRQKDMDIKKQINMNLREGKSVKKKERKNKSDKNSTEEDFDDIINQFQKENNSCSFPRCKNPTVVLFQQCLYCRLMFCLNHHQAEVHGCGEDARKYARTVLIKSVKDGVLTPGSGIPSKRPPQAKRAVLQRKLDKAINEKIASRKAKLQKDKS